MKCTHKFLLTGCAHQAAAAARKHTLLQKSQVARPPLQEQRGAAVLPADLISYHQPSSRTKRSRAAASCALGLAGEGFNRFHESRDFITKNRGWGIQMPRADSSVDAWWDRQRYVGAEESDWAGGQSRWIRRPR